ncbi:MAG: choice-of-anchor D domain-containing protein [Deltaproteobacteria bacterium]|nr:choice-of-anchor D domain-containing protein [Deltaproteobacteria bacterium]
MARTGFFIVIALSSLALGCGNSIRPQVPDSGTPEPVFDSGTVDSAPTDSGPLQKASIDIGEPAHDFGARTIGTEAEHVLMVRNKGDGPASQVAVSGLAPPFSRGTRSLEKDDCMDFLPKGATCAIVIKYSPRSRGASSAMVTFSFHDGSEKKELAFSLQGKGLSPARISIPGTASPDFGRVRILNTSELVLPLSNDGESEATSISAQALTTPFSFAGGAYPGTSGTCGARLAPGATCNFVVTFSPSSRGLAQGQFSFTFHDGAGTSKLEGTLKGWGLAPAEIAVAEGDKIDAGTRAVGSSTEIKLSLSNTGDIDASSIEITSSPVTPFAFAGGSYPGTSGTCATTLRAGESCTMVLTYAPSTVGSASVPFAFVYSDGAVNRNARITLSGTAKAPARLAFAEGVAFDYTVGLLGTRTSRVFTVKNVGGITATGMTHGGLELPFAFTAGAFPGDGGTCKTTLAPDESCTLIIEFAPRTVGPKAVALELNFHNGAGATKTSILLRGTGITPALLALSGAPMLHFGTHGTDTTADRTITVTNVGGMAATEIAAGASLVAPFSFKGGAFPGKGGTCQDRLSVLAKCTLVISYSPTAVGESTDAVKIGYFDGAIDQAASRDVAGKAVAGAALSFAESPALDYGTVAVETSVHRSLIAMNTGGLDAKDLSSLDLAPPFRYRDGTYPGTGGTCASSLTKGEKCTIVVTFAPAADGPYLSTLRMTYHDGSTTQMATVDLVGKGTKAAHITISDGPTYDFGALAIGAAASHLFSASNTGALPATALGGVALPSGFSYLGGTFPGSGGTCGATLSPGESCSLAIELKPTMEGPVEGELALGYHDGVTTQAARVSMTGVGLSPALLAISQSPPLDFGTRAIGSSTDRTLVLINVGLFPASAISPQAIAGPFSFKGGAYPGTGGTCGSDLAPSDSCIVVLTHAPTVAGGANATLELKYDDGAGTRVLSMELAGTAVPPARLVVEGEASGDFGLVVVGTSKSMVLKLANEGGVPATALVAKSPEAPFSFKDGAFPGTGGTCGVSLAPGDTCSIAVAFTPLTRGPASSSFRIEYSNGARDDATAHGLTGKALSPASLSWSDGPSYDYGLSAVGSTSNHWFTLTNSGDATATQVADTKLASPFTFADGTYPGRGGTCSDSLGGGGSCTVVVRFMPTAPGPAASELAVTYFDGVSNRSASRALAGSAAPPARIVIGEGVPLSFGSVAVLGEGALRVKVTNSGGVHASSLSGTVAGDGVSFEGGLFPGRTGSCASSLADGASCTVVLSFTPQVLGVASGTLKISYNDGVAATHVEATWSGKGVPPAVLELSHAPTYDFGTLASGASAEQVFRVSNPGGVPATALSALSLSTPFSFKGSAYPGTGGTCGSSLGVGEECLVVVLYSATTLGAFTAKLAIEYHDGARSQVVSGDLTGATAEPALLVSSEGTVLDFGVKAIGYSHSRTMTISNEGGITAKSLSPGALSAPLELKGGSYPGTDGTCGESLAPLASCTVVVTYVPTAPGKLAASWTLGYFDGSASQALRQDFAGFGAVAARLEYSDATPYSFGTVATGSSAEHIFVVRNTGQMAATEVAPLPLASPFAFKGGTFPGFGGTCGTELQAGVSCRIVATFTPSVEGPSSEPLSLSFYDGGATKESSIALTGTGTSNAFLSITDWPLLFYTTYGVPPDQASHDFGVRGVATTAEHSFVVTNTGGMPATSMAGDTLTEPFSYKGGSYPGTGGTCGATLAPKESCTVTVVFLPLSATSAEDRLGIAYHNGLTTSSATRLLTGTGTAQAVIRITDYEGINLGSSFDFGLRGLGASGAEHEFYVKNEGGGIAIRITALSMDPAFGFKGGAFPGAGGTCGPTLPAGESCLVVVSFQPTVEGPAASAVTLEYFDGVETTTSKRDVVGTGTALAVLAIRDKSGPSASYDFGIRGVGTTTEAWFAVFNEGSSRATGILATGMPAPFSFSGGTYPGQGGTCGTALDPGDECTIVVSFSPTEAITSNGTIALEYHDGVDARRTGRDVTGTGTQVAVLAIGDWDGESSHDPFPYDFGTRGTATDHAFYVRNVGAQDATALAADALPSPFSFSGGSFPGSGGTCGGTLAAGATCVVRVTFTPSGNTTSSASINISYNDGTTTRMARREMMGTSTTLALVSLDRCENCGGDSREAIDFGTAGSPTEKVVYVSNSGAQAATGMFDASTLENGFAFKGGAYPGSGGTCGTSLGSNQSCTLVILFTPSGSGIRFSTLKLRFHDGAKEREISRALTAVATEQALLAIRDCDRCDDRDEPTDFGTSGVPVDRQFTVVNTGAKAATDMADGGSLDGAFSFKGGTYPGSGGSCGKVLAAGSSCTIVVTFAPTGNGSTSTTVTLWYHDGSAAAKAERPVVGTATSSSLLLILDWYDSSSSSWPYDFGMVGSLSEKTFYVVNRGAAVASSVTDAGTLGSGFAYKGGAYPGTGGTCGTTLASGDKCTIVVTFTPGASGTRRSVITLAYDDGATSQAATREVVATSITTALLVIGSWQGSRGDEPPYDYGTVGIQVDRTFYVNNNGAVAATELADGGTLAGRFAFKGGTYPGGGGTCGSTLAKGETCTIVVTFSPAGAGSAFGTITLAYHDGSSSTTATRGVAGTSTTQARLVIADWDGSTETPTWPHSFGTVGTPTTHTLHVNNLGAQAATSLGDLGKMDNGFGYEGGAYPGNGGTCGASLDSGASCSLVIRFSPSGSSAVTSTLALSYDDGGSLQSTSRVLTATSTDKALLVIKDCSQCGPSDGPYDFGTAGISLERVLYVSNHGAAPASSLSGGTLGESFAFKEGAYPGSGGSCSATLASGDTCTIVVTFAATSIGTKSTTLELLHFDGAGWTSVKRAVTGTWTDRAFLLFSDAQVGTCGDNCGPYRFGSVSAGNQSMAATFYVENRGARSASGLKDNGVLAAPFTYVGGTYPGTDGTCGASLGSGESCSVKVVFAPSAIGSFASKLVLGFADSLGDGLSVTRNLAGSGE